MTRARFLLLSFFCSVSACFGFDREKAARKWLVKNGFTIEEGEECEFGKPPKYQVLIYSPKLGCAGGRMIRSTTPVKNFATNYLEWLAKNDFEIEERHESVEITSLYEGEYWSERLEKITELAPPTIHRFQRPWWV